MAKFRDCMILQNFWTNFWASRLSCTEKQWIGDGDPPLVENIPCMARCNYDNSKYIAHKYDVGSWAPLAAAPHQSTSKPNFKKRIFWKRQRGQIFWELFQCMRASASKLCVAFDVNNLFRSNLHLILSKAQT